MDAQLCFLLFSGQNYIFGGENPNKICSFFDYPLSLRSKHEGFLQHRHTDPA